MVVYLIFFALAYILVWILLTIAFLVVKGVVLIMAILFSRKRRGGRRTRNTQSRPAHLHSGSRNTCAIQVEVLLTVKAHPFHSNSLRLRPTIPCFRMSQTHRLTQPSLQHFYFPKVEGLIKLYLFFIYKSIYGWLQCLLTN